MQTFVAVATDVDERIVSNARFFFPHYIRAKWKFFIKAAGELMMTP